MSKKVSFNLFKYLRDFFIEQRVSLIRFFLFLLVYLIVIGVPFWFGYATGHWPASLVIAIIFSTIAPAFFRHIRNRAEKIMLEEQFRYQQALKDFASNLIFIKDLKELAEKLVSEIMSSVNLTFCAIYFRKDNDFNLAYFESKTAVNFPKKVSSNLEFVTSIILRKSEIGLMGSDLPQLEDVPAGMVFPLFVKTTFFGFIVLGHKETGFFTSGDRDVFSILSQQASLALSEIYYFKEYQKAVDDGYKLLIEKERLESAFQIAEAYRHELGNVINIISLALTNLISDEYYQPSKEDIDKSIGSIRLSVKRAQNIFNSISRYNEKAKSTLKVDDLGKIVSEQMDSQSEIIKNKDIIVKHEIASDLEILANENLYDAIRYLLEGAVRAIDYYSPKERLIEVKVSSLGAKVRLEISDTGNDASKNMLYTGMGIERGKDGGLIYFIARRIIFDHKGDFKLQSFNQGRGTAFLIELPLKQR